MSVKDRILDFVLRSPGRDDDETAAALAIHPRQTVNQAWPGVAKAGLLERKVGPRGKVALYPTSRAASSPLKGSSKDVATDAANPDIDWYWEGNVTASVAKFLRENGWAITAVSDTLSKQRGPDILAVRGDVTFIVEMNGFPSSAYRDQRRSAESKPTAPTNQAQHWYAHAILKVLRLQYAHPEALVGIALPDFPRYRALVEEPRDGLAKLGILILFVCNGSSGGGPPSDQSRKFTKFTRELVVILRYESFACAMNWQAF